MHRNWWSATGSGRGRSDRSPGPVASLMALILALAAVVMVVAGCAGATGSGGGGTIAAVGAENEYANVLGQIGGRYVSVTAIMSNPNTDPHTFEASPRVAQEVSAAQLVVQNGLGYDGFMDKIESASSGSARRVIDVQSLLGLPDGTPNPHLWYRPQTMPAVASAIASDLSRLQPSHASLFRANLRTFDRSLRPWDQALDSFRTEYPRTPVATTEPVADYMLQAAGTDNLTPWSLQAAVMNGVDPSPQEVAAEESLLTGHRVKAFLYNEQVTDSLTETFLTDARRAQVPVIGVYETMPTGYTYQSWMMAEVQALRAAVADGASARRLA